MPKFTALTHSECIKGLRVYFTNENHSYSLGESNPLYGTSFQCAGTITRVNSEEGIGVLWDNNRSNTYLARDLSAAAEVELGITDIWANM